MSTPQKGLTPIIIVVILAVVGVVGYFLVKGGGLPGGLGGPELLQRATEKDFESITDPILRKHFVAQSNVAAYRTRSKSSGKGEIIDIYEYVLKGDFPFRWIQEDDVKKKEVAHLISIGDTTYVKDYSDGKWWKQTVKPEKQEEENVQEPEDFKETFLEEDPIEYKNLGQEACGNLTCHKYEQTFGDGGTRTFWFDTKYYLLRREVSGFGEFSAEIIYTYDGIRISAPSPTKDVPEGVNIYEYFYGTQTSFPTTPAAPAGGSEGGTYEVPTLPPEDTSVPDYGTDEY